MVVYINNIIYMHVYITYIYIYRSYIAGKFGEFGESSVIRQTKLWLSLSIRQTFPRQTLITVKFAKLSRYTVYACIYIASLHACRYYIS